MNSQEKIIVWNQRKFVVNSNVFSPKDSTLGIFNEIESVLDLFNDKIPILDLCCGIGAIGIIAMLDHPNRFEKYFGFDNQKDSILICDRNIKFYKLNGEVNLWEAGDKLPTIEPGIAVCNPPFLPIASDSTKLKNQSHIYSYNDGLEVILKCFFSLRDTGHILILKSLKSQVIKIIDKLCSDFVLIKESNFDIQEDYTIAFTTWKQK
jgi:methylase of polypeptide subunit release factors